LPRYLKLLLQVGLIWGATGVALVLVIVFLHDRIPLLPDDPFALGVYASLLAGVHFAYQNAEGGLVANAAGGALAGIIVAVLTLAAGFAVSAISLDLSDAATRNGVFSTLLAGLFGALAVQIIKRFNQPSQK
jgi:hypothetical protein